MPVSRIPGPGHVLLPVTPVAAQVRHGPRAEPLLWAMSYFMGTRVRKVRHGMAVDKSSGLVTFNDRVLL